MGEDRATATRAFAGGGEMGRRMAEHDWATTALGPVEGWSDSLLTAVGIVLRSRYPMILSWGDDLVMLYNDAYIPTLGAKHPAALGMRLEDGFPEIWDTIGPMQRSVLAGGEATWDEDLPLTIERGDGPEETFFTFSYSHVPDRTGPGGVLAVLAITTTAVVTRRRLALLNAISRATEGLDTADEVCERSMAHVADAPDQLAFAAVYLWESDGLRLAASSGGPAAGQPALPTVLRPDERDEYGLLAVADGARRTVPLAATPGDGRPRIAAVLPLRGDVGDASGHDVLLLAPNPLRPYDGATDEWCGLFGDQLAGSLTAARARQREQQRLAAMAELQRVRSEFLSGVSHEFRTPLTLLLGPLEDALRAGTGIGDPHELRVMHGNAHRLLRLVDALLDIANGEAGRAEARTTAVDLRALTADLTAGFVDAFSRAGRDYTLALQEVGVLELDPLLWERAVLNLVGNALKHAGDGGVTVGLRLEGDDVVLSVADTGPGIPPAHTARVFERFERLHEDGRPLVEGSGIGLALVAGAARLHDGTADVVPTPGGGATFRVRLPARPVTAAAPVTSSVTAAARGTLADAGATRAADTGPAVDGTGGVDGRATVLVVEDDDDLRDRIARVLATTVRVATARDGVEALELVHRVQPDLVLTDVMMPRLDGHGLVAALRADEATSTVPVVVLTARTGAEAATDSLLAGADGHLTKPFDSAELLARVTTAIELAALRDAVATDRSRAALLAGLGRELQAPLTTVLSALDLLDTDELSAEQRADVLARATARGDELRRQVLGLVDWARLTADGDLDLRTELVEVRTLLADGLGDDGTVVVTGEPAEVRTDGPRLLRSVAGLVADATARGARRVDVSVSSVSAGGDAVVVAVADDGHPVTDRTAHGAFGGTVAAAGAGPDARVALGVAVANATVEALGGATTRTTREPTGTVVEVRLPVGTTP